MHGHRDFFDQLLALSKVKITLADLLKNLTNLTKHCEEDLVEKLGMQNSSETLLF